MSPEVGAGPCKMRSKLNTFEHVLGHGAPEGPGWGPVQGPLSWGQTERQTDMAENITFSVIESRVPYFQLSYHIMRWSFFLQSPSKVTKIEIDATFKRWPWTLSRRNQFTFKSFSWPLPNKTTYQIQFHGQQNTFPSHLSRGIFR